jgi:sulfatase modifying factor 1
MTRRFAAILLAMTALGGSAPPGKQQRCLASGQDGEVIIPAGIAHIGDDNSYAEERGAYDAPVAKFALDRHEVTNRQFATFVAATGYVTTAERAGDSVVFVPPATPVGLDKPSAWWRVVSKADWRHPTGPDSDLSGRANYPVVQVNFADASAYAKWAGRALPSEEQFEYAAQAGRPNDGNAPSPDTANTWQGTFPIENLATDGHPGLAPVGCFQANSYGLRDIIGNVWEWTSSDFTADHEPMLAAEAPRDPRTPRNERERVIKGGSFLCARNYCARYRPAARHSQSEESAASHLGFRTVSRQITG